MRHKSKKFTLIELIVVIMIIMIISSMVIGGVVLGVVIYKGSKAVEKEGVKGLSEKIYYGKDNVPQEKKTDE